MAKKHKGYIFNVTETYKYNPEKVKEGYQLLEEYLAEIDLKKKAKEKQLHNNPEEKDKE